MEWIKHIFVWISRITHCRGFGIQSPTDYWIVRYVINEHWPYYQYESLGQGDDNWLTQKIGRLYFRIANWRQPSVIESDAYQDYLKAGCRKATFGNSTELICMKTEDCFDKLSYIYNKVKSDTVLIVEGIWRDKQLWQAIIDDERARITFDLYYCGIVLFDRKRHKHHYIINF